ncbi:MAG: ABC transporter ATP-binding protein [Clostridiales bacterium]|jgi:peptide/nickel transport system ATP-binding protein|nr:ABC transporter ATP-binding protein [Clostridiales bacterium]
MSNYITARDARRIIRENKRAIDDIEKRLKTLPASARKSVMRDADNIVEFDNLRTHFFTDSGVVKAVDGVSFDVPRGSTVGVVGESGCGKSVMSLSLMRLLQRPQGQITDGEIRLNAPDGAINIANTLPEKMGDIRGALLAMIFQEPMTSLNPVTRIGQQLDEVLDLHKVKLKERGILSDDSKAVIKKRTIESLEMVGISNAEGVYGMYPHELSGGMRQRAMIAMAMSCEPLLMIADEPTTALDVTIQAQILDLLRGLKDRINAGIMLITHDLGVVAEMADTVVVMYAGRVVERGTATDIYKSPAHPYTVGLMKSKPIPGRKVRRLYSIPGRVPNPVEMPDYCYFRDRCEYARGECDEYPPERDVSATHKVSCWRDGI